MNNETLIDQLSFYLNKNTLLGYAKRANANLHRSESSCRYVFKNRIVERPKFVFEIRLTFAGG